MKTKITLLFTLLFTVTLIAQQGINYKAILKDNNGNVLANTYMTVQFTIHQGSATGTIVYQEDHNYTTDANGLAILNIGTDATPIAGTFAVIDWSADQHFLQTSITYSGGTIAFDATEFMAVPYALSAGNVRGLEKITEFNPDTNTTNTGWRLIGSNPYEYGPIGNNAVDLSTIDAYSFGLGATGHYSVAIGATADASGRYATSIGQNSTAEGINSIALGTNSNALGDSSSALGMGSAAIGEHSIAIGNSLAYGKYSIAMGKSTSSYSLSEVTIGSYNTPYTPSNTNGNGAEVWNPTDRLFVIGNGTGGGASQSSNALTVLKNGKVITGGALIIENSSDTSSSWQFETRPNGSLSLYRNGDYRGYFSESTGNYSSISDRSTKKDITSLDKGTLNKVMQLNPVSYLMKDQIDTKRTMGLISQEVQDIFPTLTTYVKEQDLITLSYTELIPILIKALQEQQEIIEAQKEKDAIQDQSIEALVSRLNLMESKSSN